MYRWGLLIILLCLAFFLRVWGLEFFLPYEGHPDENYYVEPVLNWYVKGEVDPGLKPSIFTRLPVKYTLLAGYWFWFIVSPYTPSEQWLTTAWYFARFWSVVFGVLTVALSYPVGKRLYGKRGGLLAMIIMTGLFLPVRESHFAVSDAYVTFFVLLAIYLSILLFWRRRLADFLIAGVVVGLAATTKLTGWFAVVALSTAYALTFVNWGEALGTKGLKYSDRRKELKYVGATFLAGVGLLVLISVRSLEELPVFFSMLVNFLISAPLFYTGSFKGIQMTPVTGWQFYLNVLGWGAGWLFVGWMIWAIVSVCWRRYRPGIVLVIFSLVFFWYVGGRELLFARFLLPIVPPLSILAAGELSRLRLHRFVRQRYAPVLLSLLTVLFLAQSWITSIWFNILLTLPDTRLEATEWVIKEFSPDTVIVNEGYSVFPTMEYLDKHWPSRKVQLNERGATRNDVDYYLAHKTDLIVLSNFVFDRSRNDVNEESARLAQQAMLNQKAELIKTFNPYRAGEASNHWFYMDELYSPAGETLWRKQPGPLIKVYRLSYENQPYTLEVPPIPVPLQANFADKMMLLGYNMPGRRANPGEAIPITLYWQALDRMSENYVIFNHLLDSQQRNWGGYDRWPQETSKTTLWRPGEIVVDTFNIPVAAEAPDGIYSIDIGLYAQDDPQATSLPLLHQGVPIDQNSIRLGPVKIGVSPEGLTLKSISPRQPLDVKLGQPPLILLRGFDLAQVADQLQLTLYWQSLAQTNTDYTVFTHVRDQAGQTVAQTDGPSGGGYYPTSLWDAGEMISDAFTIALPPTLESQTYHLVVGLYDPITGQRLPVPGTTDNSVELTEVKLK